MWRNGSVLPCQGNGCGFESRHLLDLGQEALCFWAGSSCAGRQLADHVVSETAMLRVRIPPCVLRKARIAAYCAALLRQFG